jgi:hypothetical protein
MANFNSIEELLKYALKDAEKSLQQDPKIKKVVVDELIPSIEQNVYTPYTPSPSSLYTRHMEHGGLTDPANFEAEPVDNGVSIYSTREGTDGHGDDVYVASIIEGKNPYSIQDRWGYGYEKPRHFVEPARDALEQSGKHVEALKEAMKSKGYEIK